MDANKFSITKHERTLLFLSCALQMISYFFLALAIGQNDTSQPLDISRILIVTAARAYILYSLIIYFRFYQLKRLSNLTVILLGGELTGSLFSIVSGDAFDTYNTIAMTVRVMTFVIFIIWLFSLTLMDRVEHPERVYLFRYGYAFLAAAVIAIAVVTNIAYGGNIIYLNSQNFLFIIPQIFIIQFGLKLKVKEETNEVLDSDFN